MTAALVAVLPDELLRRQERRPKTEQKSAVPPGIAFKSFFYRFVVAEQKQHRPCDPVDEKPCADEDDDRRHRRFRIRSSGQLYKAGRCGRVAVAGYGPPFCGSVLWAIGGNVRQCGLPPSGSLAHFARALGSQFDWRHGPFESIDLASSSEPSRTDWPSKQAWDASRWSLMTNLPFGNISAPFCKGSISRP